MSAKLPLPVRRVLREPMSDEAIERLRLGATQRSPTRAIVPVPVVVGVLVVAAAVALGVAWPRSVSNGSLHDASGATLADRIDARVPTTVSLDDGSVLTLAGGASLSMLENDAHDVSFLLGAGSATFDVRPHGARRWTIECGLATVTVVGTRFTITREAHRIEVVVERGVVLVRGEHVPEHARRLAAGERIEVVDVEPALVQAEPTPEPSAPPVPPPPMTSAALVAAPPPSTSWRTLAEETRWDDAYRALGPEGVSGATDEASVADLLLLADVARLSGHLSDAVVPLERVVREHPTDANASLAAVSLGRIEDRLEHPARAADAFGRALALGSLPADLRAVALSRRATSLERAQDHAAAIEAARAYLAELPDGSDAAAMRAIEERP